MKKIKSKFKIIFSILLLVLIFSKGLKLVNASTTKEYSSKISCEEEVLLHEEHLEKIYGVKEQYILGKVYDDMVLYEEEQRIYNIECTYLSHAFKDELVYILGELKNENDEPVKKLLIFNTFNYREQQIELDFNAKFLIWYKDALFVGGEENEDAVIKKLNDNNTFSVYCLYGTEYESFTSAIVFEDELYLTGVKDAHTKGEFYKNVGSVNEIKAFTCKMSVMGAFSEFSFYSHCEKNEEARFITNTKSLYLIVTPKNLLNNEEYLYRYTNHKFVYQKELPQKKYILTMTGKLVALEEDILNEKIVRISGVFNENGNTTKIPLVEKDNITCYYIQNTETNFSFIYLNKGILYKDLITEYHFDICMPLVLDLETIGIDFTKDLNNTPYYKISSYFYDVKLMVREIDPYLIKQISGKYHLTFDIILDKDGDNKFNFEDDLLIKTSCNIRNNGIYETGITLKFLGKAELDGVKILNGHTIKEEGEHRLILVNNLGESVTINFTLVNNYLGDKEIEVIDAMYKNSKKECEILFDLNLTIEELENSYVIINDEEYPLKKKDDNIIVTYPLLSKATKVLKISQIVTPKTTYDVDQVISVRRKKETPKIDVVEQKSDDLFLNINISDPDLTIKFYEIELIKADEVISNYRSYLKNLSIKTKKGSYKYVGYICYEDDDLELKRVTIFTYEGDFNREIKDFITTKYKKVSDEEFNMELCIDAGNHSIKKTNIEIGDLNVTSKYEYKLDYKTIIIVFIISSSIIASTIIVRYIIKKLKAKKVKI